MKKSNITRIKKFRTDDGLIELPIISTISKTKNIIIKDVEGNIIGEDSVDVFVKEIRLKVWVHVYNITGFSEHVNSRNKISKTRCYIYTSNPERTYLLDSDIESIRRARKQKATGYGSKI